MFDADRLDAHPFDDGETVGERRAIDVAIACWREHSDDPRSIAPQWFPGRTPAFDPTTSTSFDDLAHEADNALGAAADAVIDGLPPELADALRVHAFRTRWCGPPAAYAARLAVARRALLAALLRRGLITVTE